MTLEQAAAAVGVAPGTLRRWAREHLIPAYGGQWTAGAVGQARLVARMRERGHSLAEIRRASDDGRLAFSRVADLFGAGEPCHSLADASRRTGLSRDLVERLLTTLGLSRPRQDLTEGDLELLRYVSAVLEAGLPLEAVLQLTRVYAQAIAQIADAEVRLVHLYVHEPLMRSGSPASEMAGELVELTDQLLPLASPLLDQLHRRMLGHFIEQDIVGHMEAELRIEGGEAGRMRVAIAFADLAGYTRLTEEAGELHALDVVERFTDAVSTTLPDDARVIKSIGDGVMIVGSDPAALAAWAVGFQRPQTERPLPRLAVHHGYVLYRDGDYYGREVNVAARVVARAAGGEVLVTRPIVEASGRDLEFQRIGEVRLKGFRGATEIFLAQSRGESVP
ncbi:MAG TPA: adenylate cyclase regulatory domain-containing protein [Solirubrobacteraceae bacterium]|nr:adenylate cyclase regulatory domain-containing protein [Solirubrobacteraceae bacterium]